MEINYLTQAPWSLSAAPCSRETVRLLAPTSAPFAQVHQAQAQAELILAPTATGFKGISGSPVKDIPTVKSIGGTDVRGVPPRSRPV